MEPNVTEDSTGGGSAVNRVGRPDCRTANSDGIAGDRSGRRDAPTVCEEFGGREVMELMEEALRRGNVQAAYMPRAS